MNSPDEIYLVYDGECPLCQFGVKHLRIREGLGNLVLLDARTQAEHPVLQKIKERKIDIDEGMVAVIGDQFYHGKAALNLLALMGTRSTLINRLNGMVFRSPVFCALFYPLLKLGRRLALWTKSVPLLHNLR